MADEETAKPEEPCYWGASKQGELFFRADSCHKAATIYLSHSAI
jgi:hypothetical protein